MFYSLLKMTNDCQKACQFEQSYHWGAVITGNKTFAQVKQTTRRGKEQGNRRFGRQLKVLFEKGAESKLDICFNAERETCSSKERVLVCWVSAKICIIILSLNSCAETCLVVEVDIHQWKSLHRYWLETGFGWGKLSIFQVSYTQSQSETDLKSDTNLTAKDLSVWGVVCFELISEPVLEWENVPRGKVPPLHFDSTIIVSKCLLLSVTKTAYKCSTYFFNHSKEQTKSFWRPE